MSAIDVRHAYAPRKKRALPPTYLLGAIVAMALLHVVAPLRHFISFPWSLTGIVALAIGVVLDLVADRDLEKHGTTVKPFEQSSALVTTGAYRICRHPMYLGFALILAGLAILMGTVTPFGVVAVFVALIETKFVRVEEKTMADTFGDAWRAYEARVRRWI
jgi:protein-S-isoprenylcysteine O-methyltransferase Ste14